MKTNFEFSTYFHNIFYSQSHCSTKIPLFIIHAQGSVTIFSGYGQSSFDENPLDEKTGLKSAFGFNVGAGIDYKLGSFDAVVLEFVHHMVTREAYVENSESFGADNWAAHIGFQFGLN